MRAVCVFPGKREVTLAEHEMPRVTRATDIKLRVLEVGVCGTDRDITAFEYGSPPQGSEYLVLGHECLGEVLEVGPEVQHVSPGDLMVPSVRRPCLHEFCVACQSGRQDFCVTGDYHERGIKDQHGFLTEFIVEDQHYLTPVPRKLRDVAVLIEPLTIAEKAFLQAGAIQQRLPWTGYRHRAVVLGAGPVGLLGTMVLLNAGFETYVYSRSAPPNPKAELVESIGGKYISSEVDSVEEMARQVANIDLVYEAAGAPKIAFDVLPYLGANGLFIFTGVPRREKPEPLETAEIMRNLVLKNQMVMGTVNAGQDAFEKAVRDLGAFMKQWPDAVRGLITGRYRLEEFREPVFGRTGGIKSVITLAEPA